MHSPRGVTAPVEVSLWVKRTTAGSGLRARASFTSSGVAPRPQGMSAGMTSAPRRPAISRNRSPKAPQEKEITRSPGAMRLAARASRAPVPEPGKSTGGSFALRSLFRRAEISSRREKKGSLRWLTRGAAPLCRISWGMETGPGVKRWGCMDVSLLRNEKGRKGFPFRPVFPAIESCVSVAVS